MITENNFLSNQHAIIKSLNKFLSEQTNKKVLIIIGVAVLGFGVYCLIYLKQANTDLTQKLKSTQQSLIEAQNQNLDLTQKVIEAQNTVNEFGNKVGEITSTVGNLQKLAQTDTELLKKYSKVYFLNENYIPKGLLFLATSTLYIKTKPLQIHTNVKPFIENLINASIANNLNLLIVSAYRSFGTQSVLKSSYRFTYGLGANQFSAEQGYSEHQLGTAVDFTNPKIGDTFAGFSKTTEFKWLVDNAYKYGFILSYPESNHYYVYEPWHWRFVGVRLATILHDQGKYFYDIDQRDIDQYLLNIFD